MKAYLFLALLSIFGSVQAQLVAHDPQVLSKLAAGQLNLIDVSSKGMKDLVPILQAFIDSGCTHAARRGDPPVDIARVTTRALTSGGHLGPLTLAHPMYAQALIFASSDCNSEPLYRAQKTLFAALSLEAPREVPQAEPKREAPRYVVTPTPVETFRLNVKGRVRKWWEITGASRNQRVDAMLGDLRVLSCDYRSHAVEYPEARYAWVDPPPRIPPQELRRINPFHVLHEVSPIQLDQCPERLIEFEALKAGSRR